VIQLPQLTYLRPYQEGKVLVLQIDNPPHNYLPSAFFRDLHACCEVMVSPDVGAVILTGKGRVFSKGADITEITSCPNNLDRKTIENANALLDFVSGLKKPVIAAINGACLGGGLELALACHIRVCSEKARLGLPEVSIGVVPGLGGIQRLIRRVGESKALEMVLLGDIISAKQSLEINLVNRVFPANGFLDRAVLLTKTILSAPQQALEAVYDLAFLTDPDSKASENAVVAEIFLKLVSGRHS
jgi:enoyl-CoA hydratase/carnithine racemase